MDSKKWNHRVEKLDNPKRLDEYGIDEILEHMSLKGDEIGADVGCGTGLFSLPLAKQIPSGTLYGIDINPEFLNVLNTKLEKNVISNIKTLNVIGFDAPIEDESIDFVFTCVVLHEIEDKEAFLISYRKKLKRDGKIFIVEFTSGRRSLNEPADPGKIFITPETTESALINSGYGNIKTHSINELVYMTQAENNI